ncbi:hypothetical protein DUNSADRAFT_8811 [Dunaliella salina]|uniref:Uncharacterized protein n=1 Tax=Dunaliella salina TaxID=3046 RepID=A0ABQ7GIS2_DUNSA|nr:hypothetical protein DUNSADRAFT_8811 [Dunaliella salina]|eukprot:KAF5834486.1 hypothetical protein DUNSADRAFT_8811 [Dunaliella salina]
MYVPVLRRDLGRNKRVKNSSKLWALNASDVAGPTRADTQHDFLIVTYTEGKEVIVDACFREQFQIPHPSEHYVGLLELVPDVYVGSRPHLTAIVELLCSEMAQSFRARGMPLAPWCCTSTMLSRWLPLQAAGTPCALSPYDSIPANNSEPKAAAVAAAPASSSSAAALASESASAAAAAASAAAPEGTIEAAATIAAAATAELFPFRASPPVINLDPAAAVAGAGVLESLSASTQHTQQEQQQQEQQGQEQQQQQPALPSCRSPSHTCISSSNGDSCNAVPSNLALPTSSKSCHSKHGPHPHSNRAPKFVCLDDHAPKQAKDCMSCRTSMPGAFQAQTHNFLGVEHSASSLSCTSNSSFSISASSAREHERAPYFTFLK